MFGLKRKLAIPLVGAAFGIGGFAFLASNTFASTPSAGVGTHGVSGYVISDVHNLLCGTDTDGTPGNICYGNFTVQQPDSSGQIASGVEVQWTGPDGYTSPWFTCTDNEALADYSTLTRTFDCDYRTTSLDPTFTGGIPASATNMTVAAAG